MSKSSTSVTPDRETPEAIERRIGFYNMKEVQGYVSKHGVPKSRRSLKSLVAFGLFGNSEQDASQDLIDSLGFVYFDMHPQQINVRDKANGKIIAIIRR